MLNQLRGHTDVCHKRNLLLIDNVEEGYEVRTLDKGDCLRTFQITFNGRKLPRQVAFAEDAKLVVGGSDHGRIYLFDRKSGDGHGYLKHSTSGLVQTVTVRRRTPT